MYVAEHRPGAKQRPQETVLRAPAEPQGAGPEKRAVLPKLEDL